MRGVAGQASLCRHLILDAKETSQIGKVIQMRFFERMRSLSVRLIGAFLVVAIVFVGFSMYSISQLARLGNYFDRACADAVVPMEEWGQFKLAVGDIKSLLNYHVTEEEEESQKQIEADMAARFELGDALLKERGAYAVSKQASAWVEKLRSAGTELQEIDFENEPSEHCLAILRLYWKQLGQLSEEITTQSSNFLKDDAAETLNTGKGKALFLSMANASETLLVRSGNDVQTYRLQSVVVSRQVRTYLILGSIFVVGFAVSIGFILTRSLTKPLRQTVDVLKAVAAGNLVKRLETGRHDEIGQMATALNQAVENTSSVVKRLHEAAGVLGSSSGNLMTVASQLTSGAQETTSQSATVASAAEEMSTNMTNMASSTEQMTDNVKMVASAVEQMTASIAEIAKNAEQASGTVNTAVQMARASNDDVAQLGNAADEIGKIVETIQDIAEQTNLLALNATIEAARAGDAGKGFAVVATEVKELAKQTADSTEDIRARIEGIQSSAGKAVQSIGEITAVIDQVSDFSKTIASAVEEQSITTKEIARNVSQTSLAAATVSVGITESASASQEITRSISGVDTAAKKTAQGASLTRTASGELSELAEQLQSLVGQFTV